VTSRVRIGLEAIAGAGLFAGGYAAHRPEARVEYRDKFVDRLVEVKAAASVTEKAPVRIVERWRTVTPASPSCPTPQVVERERVVERGPVHTETSSSSSSSRTQEAETVERISPAPRPSWAISGGLQLLPEQRPVVGGGYRVLGPFWLEGWARIDLHAPAAGASVRFEF
jgi:hypothetical protein